MSFAIGGFSLYLATLNNYWFILIGIYFLFEGLFIFISMCIKDEYKGMRVQGVFQIIGVIVMMDYLLVMSLWNDPDRLIPNTLSYIVFGVAAGIKLLFALIEYITIKKRYSPMMHAYRNNDLITAFYLFIIIQLIICNYFYPGESINIFDNFFRQKPIWIYIIDVTVNATFTVLAALLALSTDIRSKTREELFTAGKLKHTVRWFNEHEVSMFFGLLFSLYLAVLALLNVKQHWLYIVLAAFYLGTAIIRFINYLWHKAIVKKCGGNKIRENRLSSFILLFNAISYFLFSYVISGATIFLLATDSAVGKNIYLFLFIIIPFAIMRFVNAIKSIRASRRDNDTYKLGVGYISLISAFFSLLEIAAISTFYAPKILKYISIIGCVIVLQIIVLVICITFIVHFFRSLIVSVNKYHSL